MSVGISKRQSGSPGYLILLSDDMKRLTLTAAIWRKMTLFLQETNYICPRLDYNHWAGTRGYWLV